LFSESWTAFWLQLLVLFAFYSILFLLVHLQRKRELQRLRDEDNADLSAVARSVPEVVTAPPQEQPRYDRWRGDFDLTHVVRLPLDDELQGLVRRFAANPGAVDVSAVDGATMLNFARRCAAFAIRERSPQLIEDGIMAVAMIPVAPFDSRSIVQDVAVLCCAAQTLEVDILPVMRRAVGFADPKMAYKLGGVCEQMEKPRDWCEFCGRKPIETSEGPVLAGRAQRAPLATTGLDRAALEIARLVDADRYQSSSGGFVVGMPPIWLSSAPRWIQRKWKFIGFRLWWAMRKIVATVTVHANMRPVGSPDDAWQFVFFMLSEMKDERAARSLRSIAAKKQARENRYGMLAVQEGRLFCLAIGRCGTNHPNVETHETMARFRPGLQEIMKRALGE
jgi:hypothetical protein